MTKAGRAPRAHTCHIAHDIHALGFLIHLPNTRLLAEPLRNPGIQSREGVGIVELAERARKAADSETRV